MYVHACILNAEVEREREIMILYVCMYECVHVCMSTYMHAHTHTYIHTCMQSIESIRAYVTLHC